MLRHVTRSTVLLVTVVAAMLPSGRATRAASGSGTWHILSPPGAERLLYRPHGLALDSAGNAYVADAGDHRVKEVSPRGKLLGTWGTDDSGPAYFTGPKTVAVDGRGTIYAADSTLVRIGPHGAVTKNWDHSRVEPLAVVSGRSGVVFVLDSGRKVGGDADREYANKITMYGPDGHLRRSWTVRPEGVGIAPAKVSVGALATDRSGGLYAEVSDMECGPEGTPSCSSSESVIEQYFPVHRRLAEWSDDLLQGSPTYEASIMGPSFAVGRHGRVYVLSDVGILRLGHRGPIIPVHTGGKCRRGRIDAYPSDSLAVDATGDILVADLFDATLQRFSEDGRFRAALVGCHVEHRDVAGISVSAPRGGFVYTLDEQIVTDPPSPPNRLFVERFSLSGQLLGAVTLPLSGATTDFAASAAPGFAVGPDGTIYVVAPDGIHVLAPDGSERAVWNSHTNPGLGDDVHFDGAGVAVGPDGDVYVMNGRCHTSRDAQKDGVLKLTKDGSVLARWQCTPALEGIAVDGAGSVYVTEEPGYYPEEAGRIDKLSSQLQLVARWPLHSPGSIAAGSDGTLYVGSATGPHLFAKVSRTGTVLSRFGRGGFGPGQFDLPGALAVDAQNNFYVADLENHRIDKLSPGSDRLPASRSGKTP